jgi:hypothetical protein
MCQGSAIRTASLCASHGFYQHLLAQGKLKMQALVAVMRKLLHAIHAMFKKHQLYDGSHLFRLTSISAQGVLGAPVASRTQKKKESSPARLLERKNS